MAQAVTQLFPGAKFSIGPAIENGFYYDFELPGGAAFTDDDLAAIEARMREIVKADQPFVRAELSPAEALELFADQPYKCEIIERVVDRRGRQRRRRRDRRRRDDQRLPQHARVRRPVPRPARAVAPAGSGHFKLMKVAGAYWRGNEKGPMLQRIYGTAWESKAALAEHLHRLEEAEKRDHRKLATELDLLSFPQRARRRPRRVAPQGRDRPQADGGLQPRAPRQRRLPVRVHAAPRQRPTCSRPPATSTGTRTACTRRWRWTTARTTRSR